MFVKDEFDLLGELSLESEKDYILDGKALLFKISSGNLKSELQIGVIPLPVVGGKETWHELYIYDMQYIVSFLMSTPEEADAGEYLETIYMQRDHLVQTLGRIIV